MKILVINPGSTSTKIAVFEDSTQVFYRDIAHPIEELRQFSVATEQYEFRKATILNTLSEEGISLDFSAVIGRGGLSRAVESGVYEVTPFMIEETRKAHHVHACDLGSLLAYEIAQGIPSCKSYIADPGSVDEMTPEAHISGSPLMPRICIWHALNQKAIARRFAAEQGRRYEDLRLIICHLGGGVSIAAHDCGRAVDANNALDGEGPFSPERAGSLPAADLIRLCFSGQLTEAELLKRVSGRAGLIAHLGTNDMREIIRRIQKGDEQARLVVSAMIWHTAKAIASETAVLSGRPDAILLTGGMAHSEYIVDGLRSRLEWLSPIYIYPGQDEMAALADNAHAALRGKRIARRYEDLNK